MTQPSLVFLRASPKLCIWTSHGPHEEDSLTNSQEATCPNGEMAAAINRVLILLSASIPKPIELG